MNLDAVIQYIAVGAIPMILAITLHEAAHAFVAKYYGDSTAYMLGRMTLNPVKHIDPVWTILVPLGLMVMHSPFIFGAAKPVPVNFNALRHPKRDSIWVAAAGPASNLIQMVLWGMLVALAGQPDSAPLNYLSLVGQFGVRINAVLMIFNLFPLLPLDGGRILAGLLPDRLSYAYSRIEPYGMMIIILLIVLGVFGPILGPLVGGAENAIYSLFGLL